MKKYTTKDFKILMSQIKVGSMVKYEEYSHRWDIFNGIPANLAAIETLHKYEIGHDFDKIGIITEIYKNKTCIHPTTHDICKICVGRIGIDNDTPRCRVLVNPTECQISHVFEEFITEEEFLI